MGTQNPTDIEVKMKPKATASASESCTYVWWPVEIFRGAEAENRLEMKV